MSYKYLIAIESPGKMKTLKKILGKDYEIVATFGHILDLPTKGINVDIKNDFAPTYKVIPDKGEVVKNIKQKAKKSKAIYICTDRDREGEIIAKHVYQILEPISKNIYRASFTQITKTAVQEAVSNPGQINEDMVHAQQTRRILDRLVGWKTSFLTKQATGGISSGRVQSVTLRLLAEREKEIKNFVPQEYWELIASLLSPKDEPFTAKLDSKIKVKNEKEARAIYDTVKTGTPVVKSVESKVISVKPYPPFITQSLISSAKTNFAWSNERTMKVAQDLYEGCGTGSGLITYMRSDSYTINPEAVTAIRDYLLTNLGQSYLPDKPNFYKNKKSAQGGHQAIIPCHILNQNPNILGDNKRLYNMIWKRTIASQMKPAIDKRTKVILDISKYDFFSHGNTVEFNGFREVWDYLKMDEKLLPILVVGNICQFDIENKGSC